MHDFCIFYLSSRWVERLKEGWVSTWVKHHTNVSVRVYWFFIPPAHASHKHMLLHQSGFRTCLSCLHKHLHRSLRACCTTWHHTSFTVLKFENAASLQSLVVRARPWPHDNRSSFPSIGWNTPGCFPDWSSRKYTYHTSYFQSYDMQSRNGFFQRVPTFPFIRWWVSSYFRQEDLG